MQDCVEVEPIEFNLAYRDSSISHGEFYALWYYYSVIVWYV